MNWKDVTPDLYNKIKPTGGSLTGYVDDSFIKTNVIRFYIEFEINDFVYIDPFYGEQKSTSMFKMNIALIDVFQKLSIRNLQELEHLEIKWSKTDLIGSFSNSLHFSVPFMKFGRIIENKISFEMEYCLTNSYSYAMMDGTIEEHIQQSGKVKTILTIDDLIVQTRKMNSLKEITELLNPQEFDLNAIQQVKPTKYLIPFKT